MATFDYSVSDQIVLIKNNTKDAIALPIFPDNGSFTLNPNESVKLKMGSSREYMYYAVTANSLGLDITTSNAEAEATYDFSASTQVLIITNNTKDAIALPIFPDNGSFTLNPSDVLKMKMVNSREYMYYYQTCKGLGLTLEITS